jgi:hypothetical protein
MSRSGFRESFEFETTKVPGGKQYTEMKITLNPVASGTAQTEQLDADEFEDL